MGKPHLALVSLCKVLPVRYGKLLKRLPQYTPNALFINTYISTMLVLAKISAHALSATVFLRLINIPIGALCALPPLAAYLSDNQKKNKKKIRDLVTRRIELFLLCIDRPTPK
jgi:hypothetical protein